MGAVSATRVAPLSGTESRSRDGQLRTTLILPEPLDRNIEVFSATRRISKNAAMLLLIAESLRERGFRPEETPEIKVHYKEMD